MPNQPCTPGGQAATSEQSVLSVAGATLGDTHGMPNNAVTAREQCQGFFRTDYPPVSGLSSPNSVSSPPRPELPEKGARPRSRGVDEIDEDSKKGDGNRKKLTPEMVGHLEGIFQVDPAGAPDQRAALARKFGVSHQQIATWFQNRRSRERHRKVVRDLGALQECLAYTSHENQQLRMQIDELRALHARCNRSSHPRVKQEVVSDPAPPPLCSPYESPPPGARVWDRQFHPPTDLETKRFLRPLLEPLPFEQVLPSAMEWSNDCAMRATAPVQNQAALKFEDSVGLKLEHAAHPERIPWSAPHFSVSTGGLYSRLLRPPLPSPRLVTPTPQKSRGDVTLDEMFAGALGKGSPLDLQQGPVPSRGGFAKPLGQVARSGCAERPPGLPVRGGEADLGGATGDAIRRPPEWDPALLHLMARGDPQFEGKRRLPAWYLQNQTG